MAGGDLPAIRSHRDLIVWQKSMDLAVAVYRIARRLPHHERYGLTSQLRRAAVSVALNIAEGAGRNSRKDYAHFLSIAKGSLMESETILMLAVRLEYVPAQETQSALALITEISKMLTSMRSRLLIQPTGGK